MHDNITFLEEKNDSYTVSCPGLLGKQHCLLIYHINFTEIRGNSNLLTSTFLPIFLLHRGTRHQTGWRNDGVPRDNMSQAWPEEIMAESQVHPQCWFHLLHTVCQQPNKSFLHKHVPSERRMKPPLQWIPTQSRTQWAGKSLRNCCEDIYTWGGGEGDVKNTLVIIPPFKHFIEYLMTFYNTNTSSAAKKMLLLRKTLQNIFSEKHILSHILLHFLVLPVNKRLKLFIK